MSTLRFRRPPAALRRAKLDNVALVPGNLLPLKAKYQEIANRLPEGELLIVVPSPDRPNDWSWSASRRSCGRKVIP